MSTREQQPVSRATTSASLTDRYAQTDGTAYATGIQALARLPMDIRRIDQQAGRRTAVFIAGYEGSPLAGYDLELLRQRDLLTELDIVFQPAVNEELAATAVQGTQLACEMPDRRVEGVTGIWYGKSPGLDRAADAMRHNNLMGTHPAGGAIAVVGDDPAAKSSSVPGASEQLLADLGMPTLYPTDPQNALDLGIHAAGLSRACGLWVALKVVTEVADGGGRLSLDPHRITSLAPEVMHEGRLFAHTVTGNLMPPTLGRLERTREGIRLEVARQYAVLNRLNRILTHTVDDRIGIVCAGKTARDVQHALATLGLNDEEMRRRGVRLLHLAMIHPLEPDILREFASGLREIVVVEEKRGFLENAIKSVLYGLPDAPVICGKRDPAGIALVPQHADLGSDTIAPLLARRLQQHGSFPSIDAWRDGARQRPQLPLTIVRTPYFCSGCPHNRSTKVPEGSLVGAGIGCHSLVLLMDENQVGASAGVTQMGGEGAQWIGMTPFVEREHFVQNLGDGTFHHSGSLAVRAAVASKAHITYKLLYNSAVAMTGGQQAVGQMSVPDVVRALRADGVADMIITTDNPGACRRKELPKRVEVWHRDRLEEAHRALAQVPGVTVLIHDQECATELRRKRRRALAVEPVERVVINERLCEGCGDCGRKSNCLSVQPVPTEFGRKTAIDQSSCNLDYSCLDGDCPSFVTVRPSQRARQRRALPDLPSDMFRAPDAPSASATHTTRITGVGGTGVVTLSQTLATAATLAGMQVKTLDQTGMSQKGGAVVSDVRICSEPVVEAPRAAAGECDLYLSSDLLAAADPVHLEATAAGRTTAVLSRAITPTGRMVADAGEAVPDPTELVDRVQAAIDRDPVLLDAHGLSDKLFGTTQHAHLLLAGAAYQLGTLPIPAERIEQAIHLNGVDVHSNVQAFRRGRQAVADADGLARTLEPDNPQPPAAAALAPALAATVASVGASPGSPLEQLILTRARDLAAYQSVRYSERFVAVVRAARQAEVAIEPDSTALVEAVALGLYKLMAYKDEYEVARLSVAPEAQEQIRASFGADAVVSYRLQPPVLRAIGVHRKLSLGPWFVPVFRALVHLRRLRGTPLDPFGYTTMRRLERSLVTEYLVLVDDLLSGLHRDNIALAGEIAGLPDMIRGFEDVKLNNVALYRRTLSDLKQRFAATKASAG